MRLRRPALVAATTLLLGGAVAVYAGPRAESATPGAAPAATPLAAPASAAPTVPAPSRRPAAPARDAAVAQARRVVADRGTAIRAGRDEKYAARDVLVDPDGTRHVRFDRTHRGLPVLGGDFVLHLGPDGSLRRATVAQDAPITVATKPEVGARRAARIAGGRAPELVVDAAAGRPALAWRVPAADGEKQVIVDATSGAVRRTVATVYAAEEGTGHGVHAGRVGVSTQRRPDGTYTLSDPSRGGMTVLDARNLWRTTPKDSLPFTDADNHWGDGTPADRASAAVDVHHGLARTWDYFRQVHGRSGVENDGKGSTALAHYDTGSRNASWSENCRCMRFGDGDATSRVYTPLDVVAHEFTHGVTVATAQLEYGGQPGALHESFSDVFGALVEFSARNPADPPDYLVGENINLSGDPIRWMDDPARDGRSKSCWSADIDHLDVHHGSGVPNKAFFLAAEGSGPTPQGNAQPCGDAGPVTGIGRDKAGAIWYRALTVHLVSNADFAAARRATVLAAEELYGSAERDAVGAAWTAVGVGEAMPARDLPAAPVVRHPGDQDTPVGQPVSVRVEARDHQGDALTWTADGLPTGLSIDTAGLISGRPEFEDEYVTTLTVTDAAGHATEVSFPWSTIGPPYLSGLADRTDETHNGAVYVPFTVLDEYPASVHYTVTGLPPGIRRESRMFHGTPTAPGVYPVTVRAVDTRNLVTTVSFTWTIVAPAPPAAPTDLTATRSGTTITVRWTAPPAGGRWIERYETAASTGQTATTGMTQARLTGMDPAVPVRVSVRAVNVGGAGPEATIDVPAA